LAVGSYSSKPVATMIVPTFKLTVVICCSKSMA